MAEFIVNVGYLSDNKSNEKLTKIEIEGNKSKIISFETVQKMLNKFLTCDRVITKEHRCLKYNEEELAKKLNITLEELKRLKLPYFYKQMIYRITLPLVRLYCSTKWIDDENGKNNDFLKLI